MADSSAGLGAGLGAMAGGIANLAGLAGSGGEDQYKQIAKLWEKLQTSDFDMRSLSPPEMQMVAELFPVLREGITPDAAPQIADSQAMRQQQQLSLADMRDVANRGTTEIDRLSAREAQLGAGRALKANRDSTLANLAARGQLGQGDELAARMASNAGAANMQADMGAQMARDAAMRRMSANESAAGMAGAIRGADVNTQAQNANLSSRFNELVYGVLNNAAAANQQAQQGAQAYNVGTRQDLASQNTLNDYKTRLENLNRQNTLKDTLFGQEATKTGGQTGGLQQLGGYNDRKSAARAQGFVDLGQGIGSIGDTVLDKFGSVAGGGIGG